MVLDLDRVRERVQAMLNGMIASIPNLIVAFLVLFVFWIIARVAKNFAVRTGQRHTHAANLGIVVGLIVEWTIAVAGALVALSVVAPSFQAKDLINMLGVGGLAIGFAFKDTFQNFLAGILLLVTHPFEIGDQIAAAGYEGTVEAIETRATTIRTYDDRRVVIPNATLFTSPLSVNTAFGQLQSEYEIHVKNGTDLEDTRKRLREAVRRIPEVLESPSPEVLLSGFAEDSMTLLARWWTAPQHTETLYVRDKVLAAIYRELGSLAPSPATAGQ